MSWLFKTTKYSKKVKEKFKIPKG